MWIFPNLKTGSVEDVTGKPIAYKSAVVKPYAPNRSACQGGPKSEKTEWSHNQRVSPATVHHMEAAFSIVRVIYGREHDDPMNDLDVNMALWIMYLNTALRAAVHLGQDHDANLHYVKNHPWNSVGQVVNETGKLISEQKEITGVSTTDFQDATWMSTSLLCEKAYRIANAKVFVFAASVPCVGEMKGDQTRHGRAKLNGLRKTITSRIRIESTECRRSSSGKIFPGITTMGLLEKIQDLMKDPQCEPEKFNDKNIFMSMYNDIEWRAKGNEERCQYYSPIQRTVANCARRFPRGHWTFLGAGSEEKWFRTYTNRSDGSWNQSAENMVANFSGSGHPIFRASGYFERGELRSK